MSDDNWYVVDLQGTTQGPMIKNELIDMYLSEKIHKKSYIWNGKSVRTWTPISQVSHVFDDITKAKNKANEPPQPKVQFSDNVEYQGNPNDMYTNNNQYNHNNYNNNNYNNNNNNNRNNNYNHRSNHVNNYSKPNYNANIHYESSYYSRNNHFGVKLQPKRQINNNNNKFKPSVYSHANRMSSVKTNDIRRALMLNIKNGIRLRDAKQAPLQAHNPPKLLKDEYGDHLRKIVAPESFNPHKIRSHEYESSKQSNNNNNNNNNNSTTPSKITSKLASIMSTSVTKKNKSNIPLHEMTPFKQKIELMKHKLDDLDPIKDKKTISIIEALLL